MGVEEAKKQEIYIQSLGRKEGGDIEIRRIFFFVLRGGNQIYQSNHQSVRREMGSQDSLNLEVAW